MTVDEQVESTIELVVARWPTVDEFGLQFAGTIESAWFDTHDLQLAIDEFRESNAEVRRALRIGDTFWVRGFSKTALDKWRDLRDVTLQARAMTKVAAAVAVLGPARRALSEPREAFAAEYALRAVTPTTVTQTASFPGGAATARPTI